MSYFENRSTRLSDSSLTESSTVTQTACSGTAGYFDDWLRDMQPWLETEVSHSGIPGDEGDRYGADGFTFEGTLRIDCYVKGVIPSGPGALIVGKNGRCEADLFVRRAWIDGTVWGDINATEIIELDSNARVFGNMRAPRISICPGAIFEGQCQIVPAPSTEDYLSLLPDQSEQTARSHKFDSEEEELSIAVALAG